MENGIKLVALTPQNGAGWSNSDVALARALGFDLEDDNKTYLPYIAYIQSYWPGKGKKEDYLQLFADVVDFFRGTPHPMLLSPNLC